MNRAPGCGMNLTPPRQRVNFSTCPALPRTTLVLGSSLYTPEVSGEQCRSDPILSLKRIYWECLVKLFSASPFQHHSVNPFSTDVVIHAASKYSSSFIFPAVALVHARAQGLARFPPKQFQLSFIWPVQPPRSFLRDCHGHLQAVPHLHLERCRWYRLPLLKPRP